jgi:hypothetical protein
MADLKESDELDLTEDLEIEEGDQEKQPETEASEEELADDEDVVTFGDGESPAPGEADTSLVRHLRTQLSEKEKELKQLRKAPVVSAPIVVGPKPTLESCEWDEDAFEAKLDQWKEQKAKAEAQVRDAEQAQVQQQEAFNAELKAHAEKRAALKFKDAQEAEDVVIATLNDVQQAVIVKAAENSAMVVYALGKHPAKLAEISKITDPLKLAAAIARLEGKLTVTKRNGPPEPERIARGSASVDVNASDKTLARLEADAERTGNRTKLREYRQKLKAKAA